MVIYNKNVVDFLHQPMFFGEPPNVQRYDQAKYPIFEKLTEMQLGYFWRPQEISLQKDRNDFLEMNESQQHIFISNLKYQTLLDSVQGRGPSIALLPYVSIPELESCIEIWTCMEMIHSRSYTYIMKNVFSNPTETLDSIMLDKNILERAESVTKTYDDFINYANAYYVNEGRNMSMREMKKRFYLMLVNINILEGIRFYVSFACTFAFVESMKIMEGSAKIVSLIARDESQHLAITQNIINNYHKHEKDEEMLEIMKECKDDVKQMYVEAVEQEKKWAAYLFSKGSMVGLNEHFLCDYVEYMANRRMKNIGIEPMFERSLTSNPIPWMDHWLNSKGLQNAPQETEIESYLTGGVDMNVDNTGLKNIKI